MKHLLNYIRPFLNWRFLVSFSIPWFLVNGWAWIGTFLIPLIGYNWFTGAASTWLAFLWLPCTPEKLVTIPAALWIHTKIWGKKDPKTHGQLVHMKHCALHDYYKIKTKFKEIRAHGRKH